MEQTGQQSAGPNPLCEVGRNHPRDRHRMRPLAGHPGVWECSRHGIFARVLPKEEAEALDRGDAIPMHGSGTGEVVRHGDERPGGVILYYRAAEE
jgi:hypothetical protein